MCSQQVPFFSLVFDQKYLYQPTGLAHNSLFF